MNKDLIESNLHKVGTKRLKQLQREKLGNCYPHRHSSLIFHLFALLFLYYVIWMES